MVEWTYLGKVVESINDLPENAFGFVYLITFNDGTRYIGRKNLYSERKVKLGKKELAQLTDKRLKKYKVVKKESDWSTYNSSDKDVKELLKKGSISVESKEIIQVCFSPKELTYWETKHLFCENVLLDEKYFNDNILGKFYKKDLLT